MGNKRCYVIDIRCEKNSENCVRISIQEGHICTRCTNYVMDDTDYVILQQPNKYKKLYIINA